MAQDGSRAGGSARARVWGIAGDGDRVVLGSYSGSGANQHARVEGHGTAWIAVGGP